jgi:hypothetical protein
VANQAEGAPEGALFFSSAAPPPYTYFMVRLDDVLEVIHSSPRRFRSVRAAGQTDGSGWRLWWSAHDRYRFEQETPDGVHVSIREGPRWWTVDASGKARSNVGELEVGLGMPPEMGLLHTRSLLAAAILDVVGETQIAHRQAAIVRATRRLGTEEWRWWGIPGSRESVEIPIDLDRGVALGDSRTHVEEIAFDEDFPAATFRPDRKLAFHRTTPVPRETSLVEAQRAVTFPVRIPHWLPDGARLIKCLIDSEDPPNWVGLMWAIDPGFRHSVFLRQGPGVADDAAEPRGSEFEREGVRFVVEERAGVRRIEVLAEVNDRWCEIASDLPLDTIVAIALSMRGEP